MEKYKIKINVHEILDCLGSQVINVFGPIDGYLVDNLADAKHVTSSTLDWVNPSKKNKQQIAEQSPAFVLLVDNEVIYSESLRNRKATLIVTKNPKRALAAVGNSFFVNRPSPHIHPTAIISPLASIGKNVYIGPYAVIENTVIGDNTIVSSFVKIYDNVVVGKSCYIKEGAVIGGEGFGFERDENGNRFRFPQIGGVIIGDNVEIGSNTCIDRGALSDTVIESHAKIDNLCHIAHNVHIGNNAVIVACSEISGSCVLGDDVWTGPNVSIRDQRKVGKESLVGMGSVVVKDIPEGEVWAGNPAKKMR